MVMKKLAYLAVLPFVVSCGSTGTDSTGDDDDGGGLTIITCADINVSAPLTCANDATTGRATLGVSVGTGAGTVAAGDDSRFGGDVQFLGVFTPTTTQGNPVTKETPGGNMTSFTGSFIYNQATGRAGVRAADEICAAITNWTGFTGAVAGAHACTNDELIRAVAKGQVQAGESGLAYPVGAGYSSAGGDNGPDLTSHKASCAGWSYRSGDAYGRTTWTVADQNLQAGPDNDLVGAGNALAINFATDAEAGTCSTVTPIACCR